MTVVRHYVIKQQRSGAAFAVPVACVHKEPLNDIATAWKQCSELNGLTANVGTWSMFFWVLSTSTALTIGDQVKPLENE